MRRRPSARLLVIDPQDRVLLFRFHFKTGPLAGRIFWATPGGALGPGESFEEGARRELAEETGFVIDHPGPQIARREFVMRAPEGDEVLAEERFFAVRLEPGELNQAGWTELEREVMTEHRWWSEQDLRGADEQVYPVDLADLLAKAAAAT